jgi:hypothetical protein
VGLFVDDVECHVGVLLIQHDDALHDQAFWFRIRYYWIFMVLYGWFPFRILI